MTLNHFIGIDRRFALLVIIDALHRFTIKEVKKELLASAVKNSRLKYWYPERRKLPKDDEHSEINPWVRDIFKVDLLDLEKEGFIEIQKHAIKITESGKLLATECLKFPQYSKFKDDVSLLYREEKKGGHFSTPRFIKHLIQDSKSHKEEALYYDYLSLVEKMPIGIAVEGDKITGYLDVKALLSSIINRIKKEEVKRAPSDKKQIQFMKEMCEMYKNAPLGEIPLVEICGQCVKCEVKNYYEEQGTEFTIFVEGRAIVVIAQNFIGDENIEYHSLRVIGLPRIIRGSIRIQAIRIFDRGKHYPTNHRMF